MVIGFEVFTTAKIHTVIQVMVPCSPVDGYQHFGGTCYLCLQHRNISALKMEAVCSEMLVPTYQTTQYYKPEDYSMDDYCIESSLII
jgi:hypothetical protein